MPVSRLFEIVYLLLEQGTITAKQLADRFEVSPRTIYRDIDHLCEAGIPIRSLRGQGGGISLMPNFVLHRSLLSEEEQKEILFALQALQSCQITQDTEEALLSRLQGLFQKGEPDWIGVDFTSWDGGEEEQQKFQLLKQGILEHRTAVFFYSNSSGQTRQRQVEPLKLYFKGGSWYLQAYCLNRQELRIFKLRRIQNLELTACRFSPRKESLPPALSSDSHQAVIQLVLRFSKELAFRVYDEFSPQQYQQQEDGSFLVSLEFPDGDWICSYILSFGEDVEVLSPPCLREQIGERARRIAALYP